MVEVQLVALIDGEVLEAKRYHVVAEGQGVWLRDPSAVDLTVYGDVVVPWVDVLVAVEALVEAPALHHHPLSVACRVDVDPELDPGVANCGCVDVQVPVDQPGGRVVRIPGLVLVQHVVAVVLDPPVEGVGLVLS